MERRHLGPARTVAQNGMNNSVNAIAALSSAEVYVGGAFTTVADFTGTGIPASRIAKWNGSTSTWSAMDGGVDNSVSALAADGAGHLFLGGNFTTAGTSPITISLCLVAAFTNGTPDIVVEQPAATAIADGGTKSIGFTVPGTPVSLTFTLKNPGAGTLTGLGITKDGTDAGDFSVTASPTGPVSAGGSTTFTVQFAPAPAPGATGTRTAAIHIASNLIGAKNPYDITVQGTGLSFTTDTDGDGLNDASEFQMAALGFDWQVSQPALVGTLFNNVGGAQANLNAAGYFSPSQQSALNAQGYFTTSQVQAMNVGVPLLTKDIATGKFKLTIGIQQTPNLTTTPFADFSVNGTGMTTHDQRAGQDRVRLPWDGQRAVLPRAVAVGPLPAALSRIETRERHVETSRHGPRLRSPPHPLPRPAGTRPRRHRLHHGQLVLHMHHGFSFALRAYHFPSATSLRIALSSDRSATSFLSRMFSFSSSLSRLTVSSLAPPYSCRHRW